MVPRIYMTNNTLQAGFNSPLVDTIRSDTGVFGLNPVKIKAAISKCKSERVAQVPGQPRGWGEGGIENPTI